MELGMDQLSWNWNVPLRSDHERVHWNWIGTGLDTKEKIKIESLLHIDITKVESVPPLQQLYM